MAATIRAPGNSSPAICLSHTVSLRGQVAEPATSSTNPREPRVLASWIRVIGPGSVLTWPRSPRYYARRVAGRMTFHPAGTIRRSRRAEDDAGSPDHDPGPTASGASPGRAVGRIEAIPRVGTNPSLLRIEVTPTALGADRSQFRRRDRPVRVMIEAIRGLSGPTFSISNRRRPGAAPVLCNRHNHQRGRGLGEFRPRPAAFAGRSREVGTQPWSAVERSSPDRSHPGAGTKPSSASRYRSHSGSGNEAISRRACAGSGPGRGYRSGPIRRFR